MDFSLARQCNERHSGAVKKIRERRDKRRTERKKRQGKREEEREERKKEERSALFIPQ